MAVELCVSDQIEVVLCDDDPLTLASLNFYLDGASDVHVTALVESPQAALSQIRRGPADVLLLDAAIPSVDVTGLLNQLQRHYAHTRALLMASPLDASYANFFHAGAAGLVPRSVTPAALPQAIRAVHHGLSVISQDTFSAILPPPAPAPLAPPLTQAELEVLKLLCRGCSNATIAAQTYSSLSTVKRHLAAIMRKLNTTTRVTTVLVAQQLSYVESAPE